MSGWGNVLAATSPPSSDPPGMHLTYLAIALSHPTREIPPLALIWAIHGFLCSRHPSIVRNKAGGTQGATDTHEIWIY